MIPVTVSNTSNLFMKHNKQLKVLSPEERQKIHLRRKLKLNGQLDLQTSSSLFNELTTDIRIGGSCERTIFSRVISPHSNTYTDPPFFNQNSREHDLSFFKKFHHFHLLQDSIIHASLLDTIIVYAAFANTKIGIEEFGFVITDSSYRLLGIIPTSSNDSQSVLDTVLSFVTLD